MTQAYLGSRIGAAAVGLTPRFALLAPAVAEAPASGSRIGAAVGSTFWLTVVPLGEIVGSLIGATVGLTPRFTVVLRGVTVGETPAALLVLRSTSGLAVGLTALGRAVGLTAAPDARPRCAMPALVRSPSSIPTKINFFIGSKPPCHNVAPCVLRQTPCHTRAKRNQLLGTASRFTTEKFARSHT